jgi:hypothetical protein
MPLGDDPITAIHRRTLAHLLHRAVQFKGITHQEVYR